MHLRKITLLFLIMIINLDWHRNTKNSMIETLNKNPKLIQLL